MATKTIKEFKAQLLNIKTFTVHQHTKAINEAITQSFLTKLLHIHVLHDREKYKKNYKSIENWAQEALGWETGARVHEYLRAYKVYRLLVDANCPVLPRNESTCRPLAKLLNNEDNLVYCWELACKFADDKKAKFVTAALVKAAIDTLDHAEDADADVEDVTDPSKMNRAAALKPELSAAPTGAQTGPSVSKKPADVELWAAEEQEEPDEAFYNIISESMNKTAVLSLVKKLVARFKLKPTEIID